MKHPNKVTSFPRAFGGNPSLITSSIVEMDSRQKYARTTAIMRLAFKNALLHAIALINLVA